MLNSSIELRVVVVMSTPMRTKQTDNNRGAHDITLIQGAQNSSPPHVSQAQTKAMLTDLNNGHQP